MVPEVGEIACQGAERPVFGALQHTVVMLTLGLIVVPGLLEQAQLLVPFLLEGLSDKAVRGVYGHEASSGQIRVVLGAFDLAVQQLIGLLGAVDDFLLNGDGRFDRHRCDFFQQNGGHEGIDPGSGKPRAKRGLCRMRSASPLALDYVEMTP